MPHRRSSRYVSPGDREAFLAKAGEWRNACVAMMTRAPINDPFYASISELMRAIDGVAEAVTGHRDHFHSKGHTAPAPH